jgi:hypothetical protein
MDSTKKFYSRVSFAIAIALILSFAQILYQNNTYGIRTTGVGSILECSPKIEIHELKSISQYYNDPSIDSLNLKSQICSFDKAFDSSQGDRINLYHFSENRLEWVFVSRHDVAQYYYRKIIAANPDDALSLYISEHKIAKQ